MTKVQTLSCKALELLKEKQAGLATAESCTGGLVGAALTAVPGSSQVYRGGIISYTNRCKEQLLGVPRELLDTLGAVSAPVAEAMAEGARNRLEAEFALSTTGLAGPGGDEFGNPVGTVFIACAGQRRTVSRCLHLPGDREEVRRAAVEAVLELLLEEL